MQQITWNASGMAIGKAISCAEIMKRKVKVRVTHCGIPVKLPWIFPGASLTFNGAPGNIQGNLTGMLWRCVLLLGECQRKPLMISQYWFR